MSGSADSDSAKALRALLGELGGADLEALGDGLQDQVRAGLRPILTWMKGQDRKIAELQAALRRQFLRIAELERRLAGTDPLPEDPRARVLEVFPPEQPDRALGIQTAASKTAPKSEVVDCAARLHVCRAACCRIFRVNLTAEEVRHGIVEWNPARPYTIRFNKAGCCHLGTSGSCTVYAERPRVCSTYSCRNDVRIWEDFEAMRLQPSLETRLNKMLAAPAAGAGVAQPRPDMSEMDVGAAEPEAAGD